MRMTHFRPQFVESVPERLEAGVLYVSTELATAIHLCACGCSKEVITPFSPTDWKLYFDGENVSLDPSIGNWGFRCRSHYWIRGGVVRWSTAWSEEKIEAGRAQDRERKGAYYGKSEDIVGEKSPVAAQPALSVPENQYLTSVWRRLKASK